MLLIVSGAPPVLFSVIVDAALVVPTAWVANTTDAGLRLAAGGVVAVPDRLTACGLPAALSVTVMAADRAPAAVGVKVTLIVHDAFTARLLPHVVVRAKSPALVPVTVMLVIVSEPVPVLVSVTVDAALVVLITWLAKVRVVGARLTAGVAVTPLPPSATDCGLPVALS